MIGIIPLSAFANHASQRANQEQANMKAPKKVEVKIGDQIEKIGEDGAVSVDDIIADDRGRFVDDIISGEAILSQEALEAANTALENYRDEDGKLVDCQGTSIVLDPAKLGEWIEDEDERDPQAERKASIQ